MRCRCLWRDGAGCAHRARCEARGGLESDRHAPKDSPPADGGVATQRVDQVSGLDQFYTKPDIARRCLARAAPLIRRLAGDDPFYIEPSAGDGAFYDLLPKTRRVGFDLEPRHKDVIKRDFIRMRYKPPAEERSVVVIGNPPFGLRGKLAVEFFGKAFTLADTVAFIVPVIFRKYFIHKRMPEGARWIHTTPLPCAAFRTFNKDSYCVNTEFQLWTRLPSRHKDRRLFAAPPITHPDFLMHQYNNTREALKVFDRPFDVAVPCQGYQDYDRRETEARKCERNKQWILFKAIKDGVLKRLYDMDFKRLAMKHITTTPGFRKGDVVGEYSEVYGKAAS